jgi:Cutinase
VSAHRIICAPGIAISAALPINIPAPQADPCPAVEVVFARGTSQAPGVGQVGQGFIDSLGSQIAGRSMDVYAVNYPATTAFASSAQAGSDDVVAHVNDMIGRCPNTRLVLGNPTSPLATNVSGAVFSPIGPPYNAKTIDLCADGDPACSGGVRPG